MIKAERAHQIHGFGIVFTVCVLATVTVVSAQGQTWTETGDAGDLVGTAQCTIGSGPLITIGGVLSGHEDVDVFCIQLTATPPAGLPLVSINCVTNANPTIYLFSAGGMGLNANMTCSAGVKQVVAPYVSLAPGLYYIAVASYDWLPQSVGGDIWQTVIGSPLAPNGPGSGNPLIGWTGPGAVVSPDVYTLNLNLNWIGFSGSVCPVVTPIEASSWGSLKARFGN